MWNDDFFGVNDEDISKLPFIDRINFFYKGNPEIEFTEEEQVYVDRAANTKTFADVLKLAEDLFGRAEDIEDKKMDIDHLQQNLPQVQVMVRVRLLLRHLTLKLKGDDEESDNSNNLHLL